MVSGSRRWIVVAGLLAVFASAQEPAVRQAEEATLRGRVVSAGSGDGLAGAKVSIQGRVRRGEARAILGEVETDTAGRFAAGPFPRLQIRRLVASRDGFATIFEDLEVSQSLDDVALRLPAGAKLSGRIVRRETGVPLGGMTIATEVVRTTSDGSGRFVLAGLSLDEPDVTLTITGPGIAAREAAATLSGPETEAGDLAVDASRRVVVRVVADTETKDAPIEGARVRARLPTAAPYSGLERSGIVATTDSDGFVVLRGIPPGYPVVAEVEAEGWIAAEGRLVVSEPDDGELGSTHDVVRLTRGVALGFRVVTGDGRPIGEAMVRLAPLFEVRADFAASSPRRETEGPLRLADTDADGRVRFERLPVQPLKAIVSARFRATEVVVIRPGTDAEVEVVLAEDDAPPAASWPWVPVGAALERAARERVPILFSFALDGERANDHVAAHHFRDPELVRFAHEIPVVLANPFGPGGAPPVPGIAHAEAEGLCTRYGGVPCSAHREAWFWAADAYLPGTRSMIAPFHVVTDPGGGELFRRPYYASESEVANLIVRGLRLVNPAKAAEFARRRMRGLLSALASTDPERRSRAADDLVALALSGDETAVALFGALEPAGVPPGTRERILGGLLGTLAADGRPFGGAMSPSPAAIQALSVPASALRPFVDDPERRLWHTAVLALRSVVLEPATTRALVSRMRTVPFDVRWLIEEVLGLSERNGQQAFDNPDVGERWRLFVELLDREWKVTEIEGLDSVLRSGDPEVRNAILAAVVRSNDSLAALSVAIEATKAPGVASIAGLAALRRLVSRLEDRKAVLPAGLAAIGSDEELVREAGVELLAAAAVDEGLEALKPLVSDPRPAVAVAAAIGLAESRATAGVPEVWEVLLSALDDPLLADQAERALSARYEAARPSGAWSWKRWLKGAGLLPEDR